MDSDAPLADFLRDLFTEGRARTRGGLHLERADQNDRQLAAEVLTKASITAAWEAPGNAPGFRLEAAMWAAEAFAWACGMLIDRAETMTEMPGWLAELTPQPRSVEEHWSVDLVFRFGFDLVKRSESISLDDDFHQELMKLFSLWPLSAVGMKIEHDENACNIVFADSSLRKIMVDRVLLRQDPGWLADDRLKADYEQVVGGFPDLRP
ncbi:hypothetical protein LOC67_00255 [Stieleria sp. JC731]|uniref:hypothetical protein n=1 Tax=Pirellulaceae TaxID=2691357 RepID=UPI001E37279E|nr:hypothetical protein [Stieleria sp. JC731]MCC9598971.1 hypothetical protein [Stieleria sp. JC731]